MVSEKSRGYSAILFSTFLYGWYGVFVKILGDKIPIFYQSSVRNALTVGVLLLILYVSQKHILVPGRKDLRYVVLRGLLGSVSFFLSFISFQHLSIALAYLAFYGGLLSGGFAIGFIFNREKLTTTKVLSLSLAFVGIVLAYAYRVQQVTDVVYVGLVFIAGIATSGWNIIPQYIDKKHTFLELNLFDFIIALLVNIALSIALREQWIGVSVSAPWLANLGLTVTLLISGLLVPYGFRKVEAQIGSIIMPLEIVFGIAIGFVVLHDHVSFAMIMGSLCIIAAVALPYMVELLDKTHIRRR
ncbi:DMT family transporter [Candidatus Woesebacteria bacterium]|nr:DMT family transporter [Candidatus Woesebacteria bacterium]